MAESNAYAEAKKIQADNQAEVLTATAINRVATSKLSS